MTAPYHAIHTISLPQPHRLIIRSLPLKRFLDIVASLWLLVLLTPILAVVALLVKCTSPGALIFSDRRVGRGGKLFSCFKFRTMYADADKRLADLLASDPALQKEWKATRKLKCDPRVTPVGYWLRRTSLDELPQLWNVLRGEMSLVGPRPVTPEEIEQLYGLRAVKILRVRPGITGLWQTSGRSRRTYTERIELDEQYVDQHTLLLDAKILVKTIPVVLSLRGAY